jgi:hypothetical protein
LLSTENQSILIQLVERYRSKRLLKEIDKSTLREMCTHLKLPYNGDKRELVERIWVCLGEAKVYLDAGPPNTSTPQDGEESARVQHAKPALTRADIRRAVLGIEPAADPGEEATGGSQDSDSDNEPLQNLARKPTASKKPKHKRSADSIDTPNDPKARPSDKNKKQKRTEPTRTRETPSRAVSSKYMKKTDIDAPTNMTATTGNSTVATPTVTSSTSHSASSHKKRGSVAKSMGTYQYKNR